MILGHLSNPEISPCVHASRFYAVSLCYIEAGAIANMALLGFLLITLLSKAPVCGFLLLYNSFTCKQNSEVL